MMTKAEVVSSTMGSSEKPERLEKGPVSSPWRSNPALQKADTEWNRACHSPRAKPNRGIIRILSSTAPPSSNRAVPIRAWRTTRTTPSRSFRFRVDMMISRSDSPIRR